MTDKSELKVGDWVHVLIVGFRSGPYANDQPIK